MAENGSSGRLTPGELQVASFWVRNQTVLRRVGYGTLIGFGAIVWGYALWGLLDAYAISYPRESRLTREIAVNQQLLASLETDRPQDVSVSDVSVFQSTDNRFDMAVEVTNPNDQWWPEFNYSFNISGAQTPVRTGYVLPHGTQILTELGYKPKSAGGSSASLVVENVRWHRMDPAFAGANFQDFSAKRFNLTFSDIAYDTNIVVGNKAVGQNSFTLVNDSAYGFWSVDLILRLYRGPSVIGITKINVQKVLPGEKRLMQVVWLDNLPGATRTEIIPQVNLLDPSAYLPTQYF